MTPPHDTAPNGSSLPTRGSHVTVNGLNLYYEVHGAGAPLVLLHGGINPGNVVGANLEKLAQTRQVIVPHMQGHGHTPDIDRPLRCETMAGDVAALIEHLELGQADLLGYSMGAGVALQTAIRHPERVRRLVLVARAMQSDGYYPEVRTAFEAMAGNAKEVGGYVQASPLAEQYPEVDWVKLFTKTGEMVSLKYDWSEDMAALAVPRCWCSPMPTASTRGTWWRFTKSSVGDGVMRGWMAR